MVLVLQALYSLSDEQAEFQLRNRLSFMRFVGLELHEPVPDATAIWLYRELPIGLLYRRMDYSSASASCALPASAG